MKRSDSSNDSNSTCSEAKRPKMDVPPPNCLRTRRPGMPSIRGRGRGSSATSDHRLGSISGQSLEATEVDVKGEAEKGKTERQPSDVQNGPSQDVVTKDTNPKATATADTKPKEKQVKSPKMLLNEYYAKLHIKTDKSNYITIQHGKVVKFTSVFTSPSTGERFMSGRLRDIEFFQEDGAIWYANKQSATTAAAARAMDSLIFRVNIQNKSSGDDAPYCLDTPYLKDQGPIFPKVLMDKLPAVQITDRDVAVAKVDERRCSSVQNQQSSVENASACNETKAAAASTSQNVPAVKASPSKQPKSPKQLLNEHYAKLHIKVDEGNYTTIMHEKVQVVKFASVFTCPQSGEHFAGGRLKNELYSNKDGVTWYANIKLAKTSAAARAIDCFTFRQFSEQKSHEGLPGYTCLDPPYLNDSGPNLPACFIDKLPVKREKVVTEFAVDTCDEDVKQTHSHTVESSNELEKKQVQAFSTTFKTTTDKAELKCPIQELYEYYNTLLVQNQLSQLKNYYVVWEHRFVKVARYTCIFVCPISLEAFACGHLNLPEKNEEAILHESLFWYNSKQLARNAAAAKALDCFAYRDVKGSNEKPKLRCLDAPYIQGKAPPLLSLPDGLRLPTFALDVEKKSSSDANVGPNPAPISVIANDPPCHVLTNWYSTYWRRISKGSFKLAHPTEKARLPDKDSFTTWSNLQIRGQATIKLYTSVFVCPWTGERFLSGKLVEKQMQYMEQHFELGVQGSEEGVETRKLVWYHTKKDAVNAAAGRALDSLRFRFLGNNAVPILNTPRYCVEPHDEYNERDIIQRLTGVMEVYTEMSRPIYFKLPWVVVPIEERVHIRYVS